MGKPSYSDKDENFDNIIEEFEYYNCNYELGYYTNFWINEEEEATS